jgi:hypothetical protein
MPENFCQYPQEQERHDLTETLHTQEGSPPSLSPMCPLTKEGLLVGLVPLFVLFEVGVTKDYLRLLLPAPEESHHFTTMVLAQNRSSSRLSM